MDRAPHLSFAVLEARDASGGTWDQFRYPGVRSDSDMFTLGYGFRPWRDERGIVDGATVLGYLRDTVRQYGLDARIRYRHRVVAMDWSSADATWTVQVERGDGPRPHRETLTARFVVAGTGWFSYDAGYLPDFAGIGDFAGEVVHPQHWPERMSTAGRRVLVVGSGATAVSLVPALARDAAHVVMLQRSPSYVLSLRRVDGVARRLHRVLPARVADRAVRAKNVLGPMLLYQFSRRAPERTRRWLMEGARRRLPDGYPVRRDFSPSYRPWDQRLCIAADGDLFAAIRTGGAEVVTGEIERFTPRGVRLTSGTELDADVVVTATGLRVQVLGGIGIRVDGDAVDVGSTVSYRGVMLGGVPNLVAVLGYANASWTLRADLAARWTCRLLAHMRRHGHRSVTPAAPDPAEPTRPVIPLSSGYVRRAAGLLPRQTGHAPWRAEQNYLRDLWSLRVARIADPALHFEAESRREKCLSSLPAAMPDKLRIPTRFRTDRSA